MDEYMKSIDLALTDEKKAVTIKWLSMRLNVADSSVSSVLAAYLKRAQGLKESLHASYVLTGVESNCPHKVVTTFANDTQLEDTRKRFERVLSETLYSVQRFEVEDFSKLFLADFDLLREHVNDLHAKRTAKTAKTKSEASEARPVEKASEKTIVQSLNGEGNSASTSEGVVHYRKGSLMGMLNKKTESSTPSHPEEQPTAAKPSADSRPKSKPTKTAAARSKPAEQKAKAAQASTSSNGATKQVGKRIRVFDDDSSCDDSTDSEPEEPLPKRRATAVDDSVNRKNDKETSEPYTKPKHPEPPIRFDSDSDQGGACSTDEEPVKASNSSSKKSFQKEAPSKPTNGEATSRKESKSHQNTDSEERAATMTRRVPVQRTYLGNDGFLVTETVYQTETVAVDRNEETHHDAPSKKLTTESESRPAAPGTNTNAKRTDDAKNNNAEKTGIAQASKKHQADAETDKPASARGRPSKKQVDVGPKQAQLTSWFKKV